jgi:hypothetical protein
MIQKNTELSLGWEELMQKITGKIFEEALNIFDLCRKYRLFSKCRFRIAI